MISLQTITSQFNELHLTKKQLQILVDNIQINTIDSNDRSLLFYNLNTNKNISQFRNRIDTANFAVCCVNYWPLNEDIPEKVIVIPSQEWMDIQKFSLEQLYPVNFKNLKILGVTGTNGKTTTVYLINQLLASINQEVVSIGTLGIIENLKQGPDLKATSPSFIDTWKILSKYSTKETVLAFEVSSHSLTQERFYKIEFDAAGWTSFSQDHLDYHNTLEQYFEAKRTILNKLKKNGRLYICKESTDILDRMPDHSKLKIIPTRNFNITNTFFKPQFNKSNLTIALSLIEHLGIEIPENVIAKLLPPPGRYNVYEVNSNIVIIDYAHTPDAIENITKALKEAYPNHLLVTIFGCGGNRDKSKRPLMGKAACTYSNKVIVTSDNPRDEDPSDIIKDIMSGINKNLACKVIEDRKLAIESVLREEKNAVILVAGKGHENYLEIKGNRLPYSDEEVVRNLK